MDVSENWLRAFVDPPLPAQAIAEKLTMAGLEVEDVQPAAPPFSRVVVGHVLAVERHPNADKLTVCTVDAGTGTRLSIVCGAPNVVAGMRAPCRSTPALASTVVTSMSPLKPSFLMA